MSTERSSNGNKISTKNNDVDEEACDVEPKSFFRRRRPRRSLPFSMTRSPERQESVKSDTAAAVASPPPPVVPWGGRLRRVQSALSPSLARSASSSRLSNDDSSPHYHQTKKRQSITRKDCNEAAAAAATAANGTPAESSFPLQYTLQDVDSIDDAMFSLYSEDVASLSSSSSACFPLDHQSCRNSNFLRRHSSSYIVRQEFDPILDAQLGDDVWNYKAPWFEEEDDEDNNEGNNKTSSSAENSDECSSNSITICAAHDQNNKDEQQVSRKEDDLKQFSKHLLQELHEDPLESKWETLLLKAAASFEGWIQSDGQEHCDDRIEFGREQLLQSHFPTSSAAAAASSAVDKEDDDDDDEFGDFQSAPPSQDDEDDAGSGRHDFRATYATLPPLESSTATTTTTTTTAASTCDDDDDDAPAATKQDSTENYDDATTTRLANASSSLAEKEHRLTTTTMTATIAETQAEPKAVMNGHSSSSSQAAESAETNSKWTVLEDEQDGSSTLVEEEAEEEECLKPPPCVTRVSKVNNACSGASVDDEAKNPPPPLQTAALLHAPVVAAAPAIATEPSISMTQEPPISLTLPITDLTTLEARFTRRRQLEYEKKQQQYQPAQSAATEDDDDDDASLDERLDELLPNFNNSSAPSKTLDLEMTQFLGTLPWGYLHEQLYNDGDDSAGLVLWDEYMTEQLCQMDGLLERVQQALYQRFSSSESSCSSSLRRANDLIHEFETNLRLAYMYWERSNTSLQLAVNPASRSAEHHDGENVDGVMGPHVLLNLWRQREEYQNLQHVLNQLHAVLEQEEEIIQRIDGFDARTTSALEEYQSVMELAQRITPVSTTKENDHNNNDSILSKLSCLDELRSRRSSLGDRFRKRLHQLAKSLVIQSCRGFPVDWIQYERLVRSTLDLHSLNGPEHASTGHNQQHDPNHGYDDKKDDDDMVVENGNSSAARMATEWSETIIQTLLYEAECCFATALLQPTDRLPSDFDLELDQLMHEVDLDWGDSAKLRTMTHNLVTIRFDFEASKANYLPRVFHCLCQGLTTVLHAHFMFLQWHRAPFDHDQSHSDAQLHQMRKEAHQQQEDPTANVSCPLKNDDKNRLGCIRSDLEASRLNIWNCCENVILRCLDEYLNFAAKRKLFQRAGGDEDNGGNDDITANRVDDSIWAQELCGLHEVLAMCDRFLALKASFLEDETFVTSLGGNRNNDSPIHQILREIFRQHLRVVHVEAMNTLGRQLSSETWVLQSLDAPHYEPTDGSVVDVERLLHDAIGAMTANKQALLSQTSNWCSTVDAHKSLNHFYGYFDQGNPFQPCAKEYVAPSSLQSDSATDKVTQEESTDARTAVYSTVQSVLLEDGENSMPRCAPESIASGLVPWVARLLTVMEKLPVIADEVCPVFANLFDLYLATVFRLCAGSSNHERILLTAEEPPSAHVASTTTTHKDPRRSPSSVQRKRPSSPTLFGSFGKERRFSGGPAAAQRAPVAIPSALEVEMCGPRIKDSTKLMALRQFIDRAQDSLQGIVNLDKVNSWIPESASAVDADEYACEAARRLERLLAAAWSCNLVAVLADVALSLAETKLSTQFWQEAFSDLLKPLESYVNSVLQAVSHLVNITSQYACVKAISGMDVAKRIVTVGRGWEEHKLHEHPNDYVEDLADRCALIWGFLSASGKLPFELRRHAWERLLSGCYLALLEGFSRVPYCSTEGRALMTLDLASFSAMVETTSAAERLESRGLCFTPPSVTPAYGMRYVDTYIKLFYYPKEDVMQWVGQNYANYRLAHVLALLKDSSGKRDQGLVALVEQVKVLYQQQDSTIRAR